MPTWTQVYDPLGHWWLSTLVAALPIIVLFTLLAGLRVKPHWSALAGAGTALCIAIFVIRMPAELAGIAFGYGVAFGLLKIAWIVVAAVYLYDISVSTGQFEIMKASVAGITPDRRLQLLLVAFCFGAFIEGAAGFGAPVAIAGAFMIGLGFKPFHAAALNLIANTAPVAWGAIGTPVHTLASVVGNNPTESDLNAMIGRILPITAIIVPFWLVRAMVGWAETFEVLPAILVVGISFAITQFLWANYVDSSLVDIVSGVVSLVCTVIFLKFWHPKNIWRFEDERTPTAAAAASTANQPAARTATTASGHSFEVHSYTGGQVAKAWMPFAVLSVFVLLWGLPKIKNPLNDATTPKWNTSKKMNGWEVPKLHMAVSRDVPVVPATTPPDKRREPAKYDFNWLTATGTACFLAAIVGGLLSGVGPGRLIKIFGHTLYRMRFAVIAISAMLGLGFITRYSGTDAILGLAFTRTGWFYPFFGTFLGWLGVALTGSDTSSNALFGSLQKITAQQLSLSPTLMCAANSAGGVMGKMVDAQSIIVATSATNQVGNEGQIFKFVVWHSIALGAIVGLIVLGYAYVVPQLIPHGLTFVK